MIFDQSEFDLRCEWGQQGVTKLASISDVVVIVDVLSFSTCVDIATSCEAIVFPYRSQDSSINDYAKSLNALLASRDRAIGYSLSPTSLLNIPPQTRLVLPSPNGSTLTLSTGKTTTLIGCLRNCLAIARFAQTCGHRLPVRVAKSNFTLIEKVSPGSRKKIDKSFPLSPKKSSLNKSNKSNL